MSSEAAGSKSDRAYTVLRERIVSGEYPPGHRLVLGSLAKDFGVSAVPVREALRRLEAEGHVHFQMNVGATVLGIDAAEFGYTMETLAYLEGAATSMSAPHLTDDDLADARQINRDLNTALQSFDPVGFTELNRDFHELLCSRCPNPHLLQLVKREWERLGMIRRAPAGPVPGRALPSLKEHDSLLALITSGAPAAKIEKIAREHKMATLRAFAGQQARAGAAVGAE